MEQKVITIGNSAGIIIPKNLMRKYKLKTGMKLFIHEDNSGAVFTVSKSKVADSKSSLTPDFFSKLEKINKQYGPALKILASK